MTHLIVMVGLPGSGKSYTAKQLKEVYNAQILSSDDYREKLLGDVNDQSNNELVFKKLHEDLQSYLNSGVNVIYDATNVTLKNRKSVLERTNNIKDVYKIAYVMNTPLYECYENDKERERSVGREVVDKFCFRYQNPQKFEGFDEIVYNYSITEFEYNPFVVSNLLENMLNFDQKNPHHIYSLGEHCRKLSSCYKDDCEEHIAGLYHDIGKLFTQKIDENGVAHYYNHDTSGTYYMITHTEIIPIKYRKNADFFNKIIFFINYHMRGHNDFRFEKAERKYRKIFGNALYERLIKFAENDKICSGTYEIHNTLKESNKK